MKNSNVKPGKTAIKEWVTQSFVDAVRGMIEQDIVENSHEFAKRIDTDRGNFSRIENGKQGYYITLDAIYNAVNQLGMNANRIFVKDGKKTEKLIRDSVVLNSKVSGKNNTVTNNNARNQTVISGTTNGDVHSYTAEKIIQSMPAKDRKELQQYMDNVANQVVDLKKMVDFYKGELKTKDKKLMETQEKLIQVFESQVKPQKKTAKK